MPIRSFKDLDVFKNLYQASLTVLKEIIPKLPIEEKFNLKDQLRRASMAPCAIIAEGYAKKNQKRAWKKYLEDAIGECNEMIVHLSYTKDIYGDKVDVLLCDKLIEIYDISGKQLYTLSKNWQNF